MLRLVLTRKGLPRRFWRPVQRAHSEVVKLSPWDSIDLKKIGQGLLLTGDPHVVVFFHFWRKFANSKWPPFLGRGKFFENCQ